MFLSIVLLFLGYVVVGWVFTYTLALLDTKKEFGPESWTPGDVAVGMLLWPFALPMIIGAVARKNMHRLFMDSGASNIINPASAAELTAKKVEEIKTRKKMHTLVEGKGETDG
jgi:hypothetical protein